MSGYLLMAAFAVATAAVAIWQWQRAQKRREALFVFATTRGWSFAVQDQTLVDRWIGEPFWQGDRRRATNVVRGEVGGRGLIAFDYAYDSTTRTSNGVEKRTTHRYAVVVVSMPDYLPTLQVTPESALHRLGDATGVMNDIELESEDFNRRFRVSAYDPKFASDVLHPRTMEMLVARPAFAFRLQGTDAIAWTPGALAPLDIIARSATLDAVLDGVPPFVWKDHREPAPPPDPRFGSMP